jgi:hypothetical protein
MADGHFPVGAFRVVRQTSSLPAGWGNMPDFRDRRSVLVCQIKSSSLQRDQDGGDQR